MAVNTKAIKNRIRSVKNTRKITKAMEMISAVKMRKAVDAALSTRSYAHLAQELLKNLSNLDEPFYPLLEVRPVKKMLVILITSNRGLCGSFNSNILKKTKKILSDTANVARHRIKGAEDVLPEENVQIDILGIGKRSAGFAKKNSLELIGVYDKLDDKPSIDDTLSISNQVIEKYKGKEYDKVLLAYTNFKSSMSQEPKVRQLLPISELDLEKIVEELGEDGSVQHEVEQNQIDSDMYIFEPSVEEIINVVLPRLVQIQLYQAVLESVASEHSARMMAMKNASDAAKDMINELNLNYNKARQAGITQEIAEIAGGAAALG